MKGVVITTSSDRVIVCPEPNCKDYLSSKSVIKYGKRKDGTQRYWCKSHKKEFSSRTGTFYFRSRLSDKDVNEVIYLFNNGFPVSNIAEMKEVTPKVIYRIIVLSNVAFNKFKDFKFATSDYIPEALEFDEIRIDIQGKVVWIWIAFDPLKKVIIDIESGARTEETAEKLFRRMSKYRGKVKIALVDGLRQYKHLLREYIVDKWKKRTKAGVIVKSKFIRKTGKFLTYGLFGVGRRRIEELIQKIGLGKEITTALIERLMREFRTGVSYAVRRTPKQARGTTWLDKAFNGVSIFHNFIDPHWALSKRRHDYIHEPVTPGMASGLAEKIHSIAEILCFPLPFTRG